MTELEYMNWLADFDLGSLEDVRWFVDIHARQNAQGDWTCAKATVEMYVDSPEMAKVFEEYRGN